MSSPALLLQSQWKVKCVCVCVWALTVCVQFWWHYWRFKETDCCSDRNQVGQNRPKEMVRHTQPVGRIQIFVRPAAFSDFCSRVTFLCFCCRYTIFKDHVSLADCILSHTHLYGLITNRVFINKIMSCIIFEQWRSESPVLTHPRACSHQQQQQLFLCRFVDLVRVSFVLVSWLNVIHFRRQKQLCLQAADG